MILKLKEKIKHIDKITLAFFSVVIFSIIGCIFARIGTHNYEELKIKYNEKSNINYKVYLKENDFFEEEYLEMNQTYIASLIDHIDIDFNYNLKLNDKVDGNYSYYIKGIISADKSNDSSGNYWKKEYILSEKKDAKYSNKNKLEINSNISINYQEYNDILTAFKKEYGVAMDGKLKVILVITNNITNEKIERNILKEANLNLNIPLTSLTIEVPIEAKEKVEDGFLINELVYDNSIIYTILEYTSYLLFGLASIGVAYLIIAAIKSESIYHRKLKKILKTYDGILVEVNSFPDLSKFEVIYVKNFEELIDAHSEIRRPINFIQKTNSVKFLLMNEGIAWVYKFNRELFNKKEKATE